MSGYNYWRANGLSVFVVEIHGSIKPNLKSELQAAELKDFKFNDKQFSFTGNDETMSNVEELVEKIKNPPATILKYMKITP